MVDVLNTSLETLVTIAMFTVIAGMVGGGVYAFIKALIGAAKSL